MMIQNILEKTFYTMSRKLYLFEQDQQAYKIQKIRTNKIRSKEDNINIKLQPWITKQKS